MRGSLHRAANAVMVWFCGQPDAGSAQNPVFHGKLRAARELAKQLAAE